RSRSAPGRAWFSSQACPVRFAPALLAGAVLS
nr:hypothetical protein [Tanacetum cinerariifolium]